MEAVDVVAEPAASGHGGGLAQCVGAGGAAGELCGLFIALLGLAEQVPGEGEAGEGQRQTVGVLAVLGLVGTPGQGRSGVVGEGVEAGPPVVLVVAGGQGGGGGQAPGQVAGADGLGLGGRVELFGAVLADGFQSVVAGAGGCGGGGEEALLGQAGECVGDGGGGEGGEVGDVGGCFGGEGGDEDGDAAQEGAVLRFEEVVAPVEYGAHRTVAVVGAGAAGEDAQLVGKAGGEAVEAEGGPAGGGEFDGEGHATEALAEGGDAFADGGTGGPAYCCGPVHEEGDRVGFVAVLAGQGRYGEGAFEGDHEAGAAGGQDLQVGAGREESFDEGCDAVAEVFAVVEDEQGPVVGEGRQDGVVDGVAGLFACTEGCGDGGAHPVGVGDGDEVDEPYAVGEFAGQVFGGGEGQAGLADSAGAEGGDVAVCTQGFGEFGAFASAADEGGQWSGEGGRRGRSGPGGGAGGCGGVAGEGAAVGELEFAQEGGDVGFDGTHGDEEACGDLRVAQVFPEQGEYV
ncbi:hypothetical protein LRR80_02493 [Streptomyces sp. RO-S4]|nr:hypothetical protein [Streptomyces sp. RO-S4]